MSENIREPQQQRSIEKKNKIIQAGYSLFAEDGYFNVNTAQIAKKAGVSTGIVYGYFHDKRDILLDVLDLYVSKVYQPVLNMFSYLKAPINFAEILPHIVDNAVKTHEENSEIHATLHSLTHTDSTVNEKFTALEDEITKSIASKLLDAGYSCEDLYEKVHLAMGIIQSFAHECVYDKHTYLDYEKMRKNVIAILINLL